ADYRRQRDCTPVHSPDFRISFFSARVGRENLEAQRHRAFFGYGGCLRHFPRERWPTGNERGDASVSKRRAVRRVYDQFAQCAGSESGLSDVDEQPWLRADTRALCQVTIVAKSK